MTAYGVFAAVAACISLVLIDAMDSAPPSPGHGVVQVLLIWILLVVTLPWSILLVLLWPVLTRWGAFYWMTVDHPLVCYWTTFASGVALNMWLLYRLGRSEPARTS